MGRLNLPPQKQAELLQKLEGKLQRNVDGMAAICHVHPRTYRDWRRAKYKVAEEALKVLCAQARIDMPETAILPEHWNKKEAARLGALARYRLYGNPGTLGGRQKAGLLLAQWARKNLELARQGGMAVAREIKRPAHSPLLAEFVGILIGDGGIRNGLQVTISFDQSKDQDFVQWLQRTVRRLFGLSGFLSLRKRNKGGDLVISSVMLVRYLEEIAGLRPGNKLRNGLDLPKWVWERRSYQVACLRGLMDTDGGPFIHRYQVNDKWYAYLKLAFCSLSDQLLQSVSRLFSGLGFHPRLARNHQVFIDRVDEARRFYRVVGSRHRRHLKLVRNSGGRMLIESGGVSERPKEIAC